MADMPSEFWGGWIVVITSVSFVALAWLIFSVYFSRASDEEATHQVWDETLREGATAAPIWWFWFILATMVLSVVYLMLYPGLGTFQGALRWSQSSEIAASLAGYEAQFGPPRARVEQAPLTTLQDDAAAMRSATHIYKIHCAACHGEDARGQAQMFPNLTDAAWQWGNTGEQIQQTIELGRQAVMPPWASVIDDAGIDGLVDYVLALYSGNGDDPAQGDNATRYLQYCSACHAPDGTGNPLLGTPPLTDDSWLYGDAPAAIRESIAAGRTGVMPGFRGRLDAAQIRMLAAWLVNGAELTP